MYNGVECKIYPNKQQEALINQTFGHTRFIWNQFLSMLNDRYNHNPDVKILRYSTLSSLLPQMKQEYPWLKDVDSVAIQCTVKRLSETFDRFFKGHAKYPKFKTGKIFKQSYLSTIRGTNIRFNHNQRYIKLPKLGWVKCHKSLLHVENSQIKSVTVKRRATGEYYMSVLVECESQALPKTGKDVGIDLGLSHLAITSDGQKFASQKLHLKYKDQLQHWERRMVRRRTVAKANGVSLRDAKNYQKAKRQVAKVHQKIVDTRKDRIHKITTSLVEQYDLIALEDLKTRNMLKHPTLARSIASQSWRQFRDVLEYKCQAYGKTFVLVNPYKTSQICSTCLHDSGKKPLDVRNWICPACNELHDRDINAARNIRNLGLGQALVK